MSAEIISSFDWVRNQHNDPLSLESWIGPYGQINNLWIARCGHAYEDGEIFDLWRAKALAENKLGQKKFLICTLCKERIPDAFAPGFAIQNSLEEAAGQALKVDRLQKQLGKLDRRLDAALDSGERALVIKLEGNQLANKVDVLVQKKQTFETALIASEEQNQHLKNQVALLESENERLREENKNITTEKNNLEDANMQLLNFFEKSSRTTALMCKKIEMLEQSNQKNTERLCTFERRLKKSKKKLNKRTKELKKLNKKPDGTLCSIINAFLES